MTKVEIFNQAREVFVFSYKSIKMNRVLAEDLFLLLNYNWKYGKGQIKGFFQRHEVETMQFDKTHQSVLATFGPYPRKDHANLYQQVMSRLDKRVASNNLMQMKRKYCFHLGTLIKVMTDAFPNINKISGVSFFQKILLLANCTMYCNTIDVLDRMDFTGVKKYLCQCHVLDLENLMTQFFKNKGVPTYSLVEAVYMIFKNYQNDGVIAYENFETDHLLLWGQYSKDEYVAWGINEKNLEVAGYPKEVMVKSFKENPSMKRCMILLAGHAYVSTNLTLLEMLSKHTDEFEFYVKPHPAAVEYYQEVTSKYGMKLIPSNETIENCLLQEKFDWCVAVNTTVYYEALLRGVPCFRYYDGSFDLLPGCENDIFKNEKDLIRLIELYKKREIDVYQREVDEMLEYTMGLGIDKYKEIILEC